MEKNSLSTFRALYPSAQIKFMKICIERAFSRYYDFSEFEREFMSGLLKKFRYKLRADHLYELAFNVYEMELLVRIVNFSAPDTPEGRYYARVLLYELGTNLAQLYRRVCNLEDISTPLPF